MSQFPRDCLGLTTERLASQETAHSWANLGYGSPKQANCGQNSQEVKATWGQTVFEVKSGGKLCVCVCVCVCESLSLSDSLRPHGL